MEPTLDIASETIEDHFVSVAERKGYISSGQFIEALEIQAAENIRDGIQRFVGEILLEQGYMTGLQLKDVIETMERESSG